jgi:hypothetical protein
MAKVPGFAKPYAEVGRQAHRRNGHQAGCVRGLKRFRWEQK